MPNVIGKRAIRHVVYDTNYWKSFIHARLGVSIGDSGCLSLYGKTPGNHQLLAEHLTSEYRVKTQGRGRTVDEWKLKPQHSDNHWLDCVVGCAVCASMLGSALPETLTQTKIPKARIKLSNKQGDSIVETPSSEPHGKLKLSKLRKAKNG